MPQFTSTDALGNKQTVTAAGLADAATRIERTGKRNIYGIEGAGKMRFYLDRGDGGPLYPISPQAAAMELGMGGFE